MAFQPPMAEGAGGIRGWGRGGLGWRRVVWTAGSRGDEAGRGGGGVLSGAAKAAPIPPELASASGGSPEGVGGRSAWLRLWLARGDIGGLILGRVGLGRLVSLGELARRLLALARPPLRPLATCASCKSASRLILRFRRAPVRGSSLATPVLSSRSRKVARFTRPWLEGASP